MAGRIVVVITLVFLVSGRLRAQNGLILERYREYLLESTDPENAIESVITSLDGSGTWKDINYQDTERANWQPLLHLKRVRDLSLAWANPGSPFYHQQKVWIAIEPALDHWLEKRYQNSNWWHNEIGVPQCMRDIIVLLKDSLSPGQLNEAMKVLAQFRVQENGVGANLTWSADLGFHYGALTGNKELMEKCRNLMLKEIKITTGEGVQPDYSFHQHGQRLQMYQYGKAFLWENVRLAWQLRGTTLAFPWDKINILTDFVLEGWQWMARGIHTVPGTMDRSASRIDALHSADLRRLIPCLAELRPDKAAAFTAIAGQQNDRGRLLGYHYFPYSDFASYHQKEFSFFLKTLSDRTLPTESINNENLKGGLLHSGDAYVLKNGEEYFNLMPVWNWHQLPGTTTFKEAYKIKRLPFAGGVSNGKVGLSVMDYCLEDQKQAQSVSARKFWACHGNLVVCLIAGLDATVLNGEAVTTLDQCRWKGNVVVNQPGAVLPQGDHKMEHVKWIYHSGLAYIPLRPGPMEVHLKIVSGCWKSINASLSDEPVTEKVFTPVMVHGKQLKDESTGYVLASCATARQAQLLASNPHWKILRNDRDCQAACFKDGTTMIAFYKPGSVTLAGEKRLAADRPCLFLIADHKLYASDPLQAGGKLTIVFDGKKRTLMLPEHGLSSGGLELD
jgi:chondroitin AC lyase